MTTEPERPLESKAPDAEASAPRRSWRRSVLRGLGCFAAAFVFLVALMMVVSRPQHSVRHAKYDINTVQRRIEEGDTLFQLREYDEALRQYDSALHVLSELRGYHERADTLDETRSLQLETYNAALDVRTKLTQLALKTRATRPGTGAA